MSKKLFLLVVCLCQFWLAFSNGSNAGTPDQIIEAFTSPKGMIDKQNVYTGEMASTFLDQPTLGESLTPSMFIHKRKIEQTEDKSIYSLTLTNNGHALNYYVYLVKQGRKWKISAVRTLWLPKLFLALHQELKHKSSRSAEEEWRYQNLALTLDTDTQLKKYAIDHLPTFNQLRSSYERGDKEKTERLRKHLRFNHIAKNEDNPQIIEFVIGGAVDNFVGFMFVPNHVSPPRMSPNEYIYIEKITNNWYLFKTT